MSFDPYSVLPKELTDLIKEVAKKYDDELLKHEYKGEAGKGSVVAWAKYPGKITAVELNCELRPENKALIEEMIVLAVERSLQHLTEVYRINNKEMQEEVKDITLRFTNKEFNLDITKIKDDEDDDKKILN